MDIIGEFYALGRTALLLVFVSILAGCDSGDPPGIDFDVLTDTMVDGADTAVDTSDMGGDTGPATCASHAECDDGIDCTEDLCTVAGTCQHSPDDDLCPSGEFCSLTDGCRSGCSDDEDCADGVWCNGVESCFGTTCVPSSTPRSCDDGNSCTIDYCNEDIDACEYEYYPECESDVPTDTLPGDVFDPTIHYNGLFDITPTISQECGSVNYYVVQATFSNSGGILTVTAGPFNMTGTSPSDANFTVTGTYNCIQATMAGEFINSDNFLADWSEVKVSSCMCSEQNLTVGGVRH